MPASPYQADIVGVNSQASVETELEEQLSRNDIYCRFLVYIHKRLHSSIPQTPISLDNILGIVKQYVQWANPSSRTSENSVSIPEVPPDELEDTHRYILAWSQKFCKDQVGGHVLEPTQDIEPPTETEIARVSGAFLQLWIVMNFHDLRITDVNLDEFPKVGSLRTLNTQISNVLIETLSYRDLIICRKSIITYMSQVGRPIFQRIVVDPAYLELRNIERRSPSDPCSCEVTHQIITDYTVRWFLFSRLGPTQLWKFMYENSYEEQLKISMRQYACPESDFWPALWSRHTTRHRARGETYPPFLPILRDELVVGPGDFTWWNRDSYGPSNLAVHKAAVWDSWRLDKAGYHYPWIKPPLFLPGTAPSFTSGLSSKDVIVYKEHGKLSVARDRIFPDMKEPLINLNKTTENSDEHSETDGNLRIHTQTSPLTIKTSAPIFLPVEIQYLILKFADIVQYPTLIRVCPAWKRELYKYLKQRYVKPYLADEDYLERLAPKEFPLLISPALPQQVPFLIHSVLLKFTGYLRGRLDRARLPVAFEFGKIYSTPDPDDPAILADTQMFESYANDPIILSDSEDPKPTPYAIRAVFRFPDRVLRLPSGILHTHENGIRVDNTMTIKELLAVFYGPRGLLWKSRRLPPDGILPGAFDHFVARGQNMKSDPEGKLTDPFIELTFCSSVA
ncbi:hypothetical protein TWF694_008253 [Orbilia ellipsospora]|uniref:F-box domain-containing protein n=1 Tax=Orbilia ellipsospora TaxID=2528407 RepID=A0AAV9XGI4_9PEZI